MVVIPAECCQVFGVVGAALGSGQDVVDFESVSAAASVGGASAVTGENVAAHPGRDHLGSRPDAEDSAILEFDVEADRPVAEGFFEGVDPDARSLPFQVELLERFVIEKECRVAPGPLSGAASPSPARAWWKMATKASAWRWARVSRDPSGRAGSRSPHSWRAWVTISESTPVSLAQTVGGCLVQSELDGGVPRIEGGCLVAGRQVTVAGCQSADARQVEPG